MVGNGRLTVQTGEDWLIMVIVMVANNGIWLVVVDEANQPCTIIQPIRVLKC